VSKFFDPDCVGLGYFLALWLGWVSHHWVWNISPRILNFSIFLPLVTKNTRGKAVHKYAWVRFAGVRAQIIYDFAARVSHFQVWKISSKIQKFSIFTLGSKKSHWVGSKNIQIKAGLVLFTLGQKYARVVLVQDPSLYPRVIVVL